MRSIIIGWSLCQIYPAIPWHCFRKAVNKLELLANTVLRFTIVCIFGGRKLLYKMLSVEELDPIFYINKPN